MEVLGFSLDLCHLGQLQGAVLPQPVQALIDIGASRQLGQSQGGLEVASYLHPYSSPGGLVEEAGSFEAGDSAFVQKKVADSVAAKGFGSLEHGFDHDPMGSLHRYDPVAVPMLVRSEDLSDC